MLHMRCFPLHNYVLAADLRNKFISQQQQKCFVYSADVFVLPGEYLLVCFLMPPVIKASCSVPAQPDAILYMRHPRLQQV